MATQSELNAILGRWRWRALLIGIIAIAVCVVDTFLPVIRGGQTIGNANSWMTKAHLSEFLQAYLVAYIFWLGITIGCLALSMIHQLVHGTWGLATSRIFESASSLMPLMAILFLPIWAGMNYIYPWVHMSAEFAHEHPNKAAYLQVTPFTIRAVGYFVVWILFSQLLNSWSLRLDAHPSDRLTRNLRRISAGGLVLVGISFTFALIDWLMSLEPDWYSTMYGPMISIGALLTSFAFTIIVLSRMKDEAPLREVARPQAFHDLGSLLLAFVILWAYLSYSQYLIIWSGNTLEEIGWYMRRLSHGWQFVALAIVILHFVVPFLLLLSKERKRNSKALRRLGVGLLMIDYVNLVWVVVPAFGRRVSDGTDVAMPPLRWIDFVMPLAIGGLWIFCFTLQAARRPMVSTGDPAWVKLEEHQAHGVEASHV